MGLKEENDAIWRQHAKQRLCLPTAYHIDELNELQPDSDDDDIAVILHRAHHLVVVPEQVFDQARLVLIAQGRPGCVQQNGICGRCGMHHRAVTGTCCT